MLPFPQAPDGIELRHLRAFVAVAEELNFGSLNIGYRAPGDFALADPAPAKCSAERL